MSLPDDIETSLQIRLNMFTQTGLKPDDPEVIMHVRDYIVALLLNDDVRKHADEYKASLKETQNK